MKVLYCANCGIRLPIFRKALPAFGKIIDLVEPHECSEEPVEIDLTPIDIPPLEIGPDNKYVQKLNALQESETLMKGAGDRRSTEHTRKEISDTDTTAPEGLRNLIDKQPNTQPASDINEEPNE